MEVVVNRQSNHKMGSIEKRTNKSNDSKVSFEQYQLNIGLKKNERGSHSLSKN